MIRTVIMLMLAVLAGPTQAQIDYPTRAIRLVVAFPAGGISDVLARAIAAKMSTTIGQNVFVENKPGAGSTLAGDLIAKSAPDGHTIWLQDMTAHAINATLYAKLPYDSIRDFAPVTLVASTPLMLVVHPSTPARTLAELASYLKANAGKLSYGSSGNGTPPHLAGEMLKTMSGLDVQHVPYKGSAPATLAILANEVVFTFSTMPPAVSNAKAGKLRAIAVTTAKRVGAMPDVPTMIEAGLSGFELVLFTGILAPPGTPASIVSKLNAEFAKEIGRASCRERVCYAV